MRYVFDIKALAWRTYEDYTDPVPLPRYITDIPLRHVFPLPRYITDISLEHIMPLSAVTRQYDFIVDEGAKNLGSWIDAAAVSAGR